MKLAIVTPTYQRSDNKTPYYLNRAIDALKRQTHTEFKYYLIGDKYENSTEFESFANFLTGVDHHMVNLPVAKEREKYPLTDRRLWCCGGVNAYNHGIDLAMNDGYDWICHLDHDDYWSPDHLSVINLAIENIENAALVYTCAEHIKNQYLPRVPLDNKYFFHSPVPCNAIHSSVCINHRLLPLKYRDVYEETGQVVEADIDMWNRVTQHLSSNQNLKSVLYTKITCHHTEEGVNR